MELSWGWQKSSLDGIPNRDGGINEVWSHVDDFWRILLRVEKNLEDSTIDILNGSLGWWGHVDGEEVSLQSMWNIITSTTWMVHGSEELHFLNTSEVSTLILGEEIETFLLNELSGNLKSNLITPKVDERHGDIIQEDGHSLTTWWGESSDLFLLNFSFDRLLEVIWSGGTGEVDSLEEHFFWIELAAVNDEVRGLGGTWTSDKKGVSVSWLLSSLVSHVWKVSNLVDDILNSSGVTSWDKKLRELNSLWRSPAFSLPKFPLLGGLINIVVKDSLFVNGTSLSRDWWKWGVFALEIFVELLSVFILEKTGKGPSEAVDEQFLECSLVNSLSGINILGKKGPQEVKELVDSNDWWGWHDVVVVSVQDVEQVVYALLLNVLLAQIMKPGGLLWVAAEFVLSSVGTIGSDKWLPTEIGGRDVDDTTS